MNNYTQSVQDYLITSNYEQFLENLSKEERKAKREGRKASGTRTVDKIKDAVKKFGKFGLLAIFQKPMEKALKKRGVQFKSGDMEDVAVKFYGTFVGKKKDKKTEHLGEDIIKGIISGIISFFRSLKSRKDQGGELSETESDLLQGAENATDIAKDQIKQSVQFDIGKFLTDYWWIIALAVYFLFFRK